MMELDRFTVVFLLLRADYVPSADDEQIQLDHMAHLEALRARGKMVAAGPTGGEKLRGIAIFNTDVEETTRIMQEDPAVRAGWFDLEITPWLVPKGEINTQT